MLARRRLLSAGRSLACSSLLSRGARALRTVADPSSPTAPSPGERNDAAPPHGRFSYAPVAHFESAFVTRNGTPRQARGQRSPPPARRAPHAESLICAARSFPLSPTRTSRPLRGFVSPFHRASSPRPAAASSASTAARWATGAPPTRSRA